MLSDRRQRVLAALIEEYVACALPVGSRTLTEHYRLGVSASTVRNELSFLEDAGFIAQPHTSAGRIPTDIGYRTFVDKLLSKNITETENKRFKEAAETLRKRAAELDDLINQTQEALTNFTDCLSIVLAPSVLNLHVKQLSLISLSQMRALIVVVSEDGHVFNRNIEFNTSVSPDELACVQNTLCDIFSGKSLHDIEKSIESGMCDDFLNPLLQFVFDEVLRCIKEGQRARTSHVGVSSLLAQPEFNNSTQILPLIQVLEDDTVLLQILDEAAGSDPPGPHVRIGSENSDAGLSGVSVVASRYGEGDNAGVVAVVGPTRMDYSKVINAVRVAGAALSGN